MRTISTFKVVLVISASFALTAVGQPSLGTTALLEGPGVGVDSVVLGMAAPTDTWTVTANDAWLHLDVTNQSGTGSTNVVFSYDANPGATRAGTLTIAGLTLTVTQVASTYVAAPGPVTTLVASGLSQPYGVGVDGAGNVYIGDTFHYAVKEWKVSNNTVSTLVASGLQDNFGLAVDGAANVYIADSYHSTIKKWAAANGTVTTLVASGLSYPYGVAVDGAGNVYIADSGNNAIKKWTVANNTVTTVVASGLYDPYGVAVDVAGNVYIGDTHNNTVKKWTAANNTVTTLVTSGLSLPMGVAVDGAGNVYIANRSVGNGTVKKLTMASNTVLTLPVSGLWSPTAVAVDGAGNVYIADSAKNTITELPYAFVDPSAKWESSAAGSDVLPVVLPATANLRAPFAPTSDQGWLTITGITNGVVSFAFGATTTNRTAHITLLGQPVSVTQLVGITQQPAQLTVCAGSPALFSVGATGGGLTYQWQVSGDGGITFTNISVTATNAAYTNVAPTLADNGNAYRVILTCGGGWSVTSAPPSVLTLNPATTVSAGGNQTICAGSSTLGLGGSVGGAATGGIWSSSGAGSFVPDTTTLNAAYAPSAADITTGAVTLTLTATGQLVPCPASAQVIITINGLPVVANPPTNLTVAAGSPAVFSVGATGAGLTYQWQVSQDAGTTFTNISSTATNANYTNATTSLADDGNRYQVIVGGACPPPVTSSPPAVLTVRSSLGTTALLEGPSAGSDSVVLLVNPATTTWTATANDAWLHLSVANQSGAGSTNVVFSYDANTGATRTGTLTIAGQTLTVTQAGSTYVPAPGPVTTLVASGLNNPYGVGVDGAGNVYIADTYNSAIKEWIAANNAVSTLVGLASGQEPCGVAVDGAGNVYFSYLYSYSIFGGTSYSCRLAKWTPASHSVTTLVDEGSQAQFGPGGVAVDGVGNVYFAYSIFQGLHGLFGELDKWTAVSNTVSRIVSWNARSTDAAGGVALDGAGNVYIADISNDAITEWTAANNTLTTLVASGLHQPWGVAVDGAGNTYIADTHNNAIKKWSAANNSVTTLVASGLSNPNGVAVDGAGNIYIADGGNNAVKELPHAFVEPTAKWESAAAASDVLPVVLPATANLLAPFAPTSDQPWLTITGTTNGVVSFALSANTGTTDRTANITLLGQPIAITQMALPAITNQPASLTVCAASPAVFTVAASGSSLAYQWQMSLDGGTTFTNISTTATNASYTNTAASLADDGNQYQVIVSTGGAAVTSAPPAVLTVNGPTTAGTGGNQTICAGSATAGLGGTVGGGAMGGAWSSSGTGTFAPDATALNASYTPSAADIAGGAVTLTLSSTGQTWPCGAATAQVVLTIPPVSVVPPTLLSPTWLGNGLIQLTFSNNDPCASFTVLAATNPSLPLSNWTVAGPATSAVPGVFQFTTSTTNTPQGYYRVRSP